MRQIRFLIFALISLVAISALVNAMEIRVETEYEEEILDGQTIKESGVNLIVTPDDGESSIIYRAGKNIERKKFRTFCSRCNIGEENVRRVKLSSGENKIEVDKQEVITIFVDKKVPRIVEITPKSGSHSDGEINLKFREDNPVSASLFYREKTAPEFREVPLDIGVDCETNGNRHKDYMCSINPEFPENSLIHYYFAITDEVSETVGNQKTITIDTMPPVIDILTPIENGDEVPQRLLLHLSTNEISNMRYEINYNGRTKPICRNCIYKEKLLRTRPGLNIIKFTAEDPAGNIGERVLEVITV